MRTKQAPQSRVHLSTSTASHAQVRLDGPKSKSFSERELRDREVRRREATHLPR